MNRNDYSDKILYDYLCIHAQNAADKTFLAGARNYTFGDALSVVQSLMVMFNDCGIKKGELVSLRMTRTPESALLAVALGAVGAVCVMTDCHNKVSEFLESTNTQIFPRYAITDEGGCWKIITPDGERNIVFNGRDVAEIAARLRASVSAKDPFMIIFTSGSTGKSKAVTLSHTNCVANPADAMPLFCENEKDVAISLLPLHHVFGFAVFACALYCGHSVIFPAEVVPEAVLECIQRYSVTVLYSVPTLFLDLIEDDLFKNYDISSLRLGLMAGGPFTCAQMRDIESKLGLRLMPGYGMSECVGISTMSYGDSVEERAAGVGRLYPSARARILGEDGMELASGSEGEICVKSPTMMLGYYGDDALTAEVIDSDGWLHTGDLGYMDSDGILHVSGRKKDIIIRNGNNLSSVAIEQKIQQLEAVKAVCVVGIKDEREGEVPVAGVVLKTGKKLNAEELKNILLKIECPKIIKILPAIPLTSSGKHDKQALRSMFL